MKEDSYAVLRIPDFRNFVTARFLAVIGVQLQSVVVGWQVFEKTKDPLSLGLIGLAEIIPSISVSLFAGHIADRINRKKIVVYSFLVYFLCVLALLFFSLNLVPIDYHNVYPIYTVIFVSGLARGFLQPAMSAFMAQLVPKELYPRSSAWNSIAWQTAAVTGPAIGGLLYGLYGAEISYTVDAVILFSALFFYIMIQPRPVPENSKNETLAESMLMGFKFVFSNQVILSALSLDMFAVLFGGAVALLPIFASDILHKGPEVLGILRASPAVGAAIMALFLAHLPLKKNAGIVLLTAVAGFGFCMIFFALSKNLYLSLFLLGLSGAFDSISVVLRATIVQTMTPDHMRGRVSSVNSIFIGSSNELGAFESGVAAKLMGTVPSVVFGGTMTILVVLVSYWKSPELRKLHFTGDKI